MLMGHVLAWWESPSLSLSSVSSVSLSTTPPSIFSYSLRNRSLLDDSVSNRRWCLLVSLALLEASVINRRWCRLVSLALPEASVMIDDGLSSSISLSSTPPWETCACICPRLSLSSTTLRWISRRLAVLISPRMKLLHRSPSALWEHKRENFDVSSWCIIVI